MPKLSELINLPDAATIEDSQDSSKRTFRLSELSSGGATGGPTQKSVRLSKLSGVSAAPAKISRLSQLGTPKPVIDPKLEIPTYDGQQPHFLSQEELARQNNPNYYEETRQAGIADQQNKLQAAAAQAQQEAAKQAEANDPKNWSSDRFKKEAPKPKTLQEKAAYDAVLEQKKAKEDALKEQLLPADLQKPKPTIIEAAKPHPFLRDVFNTAKKLVTGGPAAGGGEAGSIAGQAAGIDEPSVGKSQAIYLISEHTKLPRKEVVKHFDELSRKFAREAGIGTVPTAEEYANMVMTGLIPITAEFTAPLEIAKGIAQFVGVKEVAERGILPAAKALYQKLSGDPVKYEVTKLKELFPEKLQDWGTVAEFMLYGYGTKKLGDALADPQVASILATARFRIGRALGIKMNTALAPLTKEQIIQGFGGDVAAAARHSEKVFQAELAKRTAGEKPVTPEVKAAAPEVTPAAPETSSAVPQVEPKPDAQPKVVKLSQVDTAHFQQVVTKAGGIYKGYTPGFVKKDGSQVEGLVQFLAPSGTTVALKPSELSHEAVKAKIESAGKNEKRALVQSLVRNYLNNPDVGLSPAEAIDYDNRSNVLTPDEKTRLASTLSGISTREDAYTLSSMSKQDREKFDQNVEEIASQIAQEFNDKKTPATIKVRKVRKSPTYNAARAADRNDRATLILAHGGFSYPAGMRGEIGEGVQRLKNMGKLRRYLRKDGPPIDILLRELKTEYPHLFNKYQNDSDLLGAILSGEIKKGIVDLKEEEARLDREIEQYYEKEEAIRKEAASEQIPEQDVEEVAQQPPETKRTGSEVGQDKESSGLVSGDEQLDVPAVYHFTSPDKAINLAMLSDFREPMPFSSVPADLKSKKNSNGALIEFDSGLLRGSKGFFKKSVGAELQLVDGENIPRSIKKITLGAGAKVSKRGVVLAKRVFDISRTPDGRYVLTHKKSSDSVKDPGQQLDLLDAQNRVKVNTRKESANEKEITKKSIEAISREQGDIEVKSPSAAVPIWESSLALRLKKTGTLLVPSSKVSSPADIAFAFQSLKNEVQEHFLLGAMKAGHIVGVELIHIGSIDESMVSLYELVAILQAHDADEFFMVHHHPSGRIEPSPKDYNITTKAKSALGKIGIGFRGHVIINDTKFGFIDENNGFEAFQHKEYLKTHDVGLFRKYAEWLKTKDARTQIKSPADVFEIAKGITAGDGQTLLFLLDKGNRIQSAVALPHASVNAENVVKSASAFRATAVILAGSNKSRTEISSLSDFLKDFHIKLMDSVTLSGGAYKSAREDGTIGEPDSEYGLGVKETDPDDYGIFADIKKPADALEAADKYTNQRDLFDEIPPDMPKVLGGIFPEHMKDISGFKAGYRDIYRNLEESFGETFPIIDKSLLTPLDNSRGRFIEMQKKWTDDLYKTIVKGLGIKKGSELSAAVQEFGEGKLDEADLKRIFGDEKAQKIMAADKWFREAYNELIDLVNNSIAKIYPGQNEKLVPYRYSYYRHFREFSQFSGLVNIFDTPAQIPSSLAGISQFTKPKSRFLAFAQRRMGLKTEIDAVGGFLDYIPSAAYATHISPNITKFRSLAKELRDATKEDPTLNNLIEYLDDFAGDLAGKTSSSLDRFFMKRIPGGRKTMRVLDWINNRVKANVILGNASSSIAQLFNIPQGVGFTKIYSVLGAGDTMAQIFKPSAEMAKSGFIKARYSDSMYDKFDTRMLEHARNFTKWMLTVGDEIGTKFIWNSAYRMASARKMRDPIKFADDVARKMVAGRSVGEVPIEQKSKVFQLLAPFQLEVANLWWALRDFVSGKDFSAIVVFMIAAWLMNKGAKKVRGTPVIMDPIQAFIDATKPDMDPEQRVGRVLAEILSNIPLGDRLAVAYPEFGFEIAGRKFPTREQFYGRNTDPTRFGGGILSLRGIQDPLFKLLPPFGGQQVKRALEGLSAVKKGIVKLNGKYVPIKDSLKNNVIASLFGKYAVPEIKDYFRLEEERATAAAPYTKARLRKSYEEQAEREVRQAYVKNSMLRGDSIQEMTRGKKGEEKKKMAAIYKREKIRATSDPIAIALTQSTSNAQKEAVLTKASDNFKTFDEFKDYVYGLAQKKVVHVKVARAVINKARAQRES